MHALRTCIVHIRSRDASLLGLRLRGCLWNLFILALGLLHRLGL
jgi:hypothetical protein